MQLMKHLDFSLRKDKDMLCFGLGTTDPKGIFSTTINLKKKFGIKRVFDVPASENALTGISVGLSLEKYKICSKSSKIRFFLLAMDQLVNNAAKNGILHSTNPFQLQLGLL